MFAVARIAAWVCALELLWAVFVGTTQSTELIAGLVASALTVLFVEALRAQGLLPFRPSRRAVLNAWSVPGQVLFDFALVLLLLVRALLHGRRVRGQWVEVPYPVETGEAGRFRRALDTILGNATANSLVVDLGGGRALLHALSTRVFTSRSVP